MKIESKKYYFLSLFFVIVSGVMFAQTQTSFCNRNNLELVIIPKIGFATFKESGTVPINGFVDGEDVLISLKMNRKLNLLTGFGYFEFEGNRNVGVFSSSFKNSYLRIPLILTSNIAIFKGKTKNENIFLELGFGLYGNNLFKQDEETISATFIDKNIGWNFGFSAQLGIKFILSEMMNLGIGFESQNDFSKITNNNNETLEDLNTINLSIGFSF